MNLLSKFNLLYLSCTPLGKDSPVKSFEKALIAAALTLPLFACGAKINHLDTQSVDSPKVSNEIGGASTSYDIWLAIQGNNSRSEVAKLAFNSATNALTLANTADVSSTVGGGSGDMLRALTFLSDGSILAGGTPLTLAHLNSSTMISAAPATIALEAGHNMTEVHAMCILPGGNVLAGGFTEAINEFTPAGIFVRTFHAAPTYTLSDCAATSPSRVFWVDYDGYTDSNGDVVISDYSAGAWNETARYSTNVELGAMPDSDFYSLVAHTNGYVYAFPQSLSATSNQKILRCSATGNLTDCTLVGPNLNSIDATMDTIQSARQLPGQEDILFFDSVNFRAYRYAPSTTSVTALDTLTSLGLTQLTSTRALLIRAQ